jgi:hypothetical protein
MKMEKMYEYIILADGKVVLKGRNLKQMWKQVKEEYPDRRLSIRWEPPAGILIA